MAEWRMAELKTPSLGNETNASRAAAGTGTLTLLYLDPQGVSSIWGLGFRE